MNNREWKSLTELDYEAAAKRKKRFKLAAFLAAVAVATTALAVISPDWNRVFDIFEVSSVYLKSEEYPLSVFVLDSGSANCVLIKSIEANIIVDCGHEKADKNILDTLDILKIDHLDLVILTHPDKDHIGNMEQVVGKYSVDRFVTCENGDYELSELYEELITALNDKNIEIQTVGAGEKIDFGRLTLEVVSPIMVYDTPNDNSVAVRLCYGDFTAMLTGDISEKAEKDILASKRCISSDVLLAAHHGSGSSTCEEFLEAVSPKYAVISVEQNDYLPNDKTLARLCDFGCEIFRTDKQGSIAVMSDGSSCEIFSEL
ncbi:MAG: MBL fold metallo-hydrolase [Clostridia bacterium]|nr:MBL fold metallo-hydrolase [Clostridia bacterium]